MTARRLAGPLLCLDPSSTACGWALFGADGRPYAFDRVAPPARLPSVERIDRIAEDVRRIAEMAAPAAAVMEWSSGHTAGRLRKARGLAVMGQAQGAVREVLKAMRIPVATVSEADWTGRAPKKKRADRLRWVVPNYDPKADPGLDVADALGIGLWFFGKLREKELIERANA